MSERWLRTYWILCHKRRKRRAKETYDLGGRRMPAGSQRNGFYIENGKVIYKK